MSEDANALCVTIVAEAIIEDRITQALVLCGAHGWTMSMAEGHGPSGHGGVSEIQGGNVRIETLVSAEVGAAIWRALEADFFPHYAVSAWEYDVKVARLARYADPT